MAELTYSDTQKILFERIQELEKKIADANSELEQTKEAFDATFKISKERRIFYVFDSTFRQKIFYCLNKKKHVLSIKDMTEILTKVDPSLGENTFNTARSLRVQIRRMLEEGILVKHKTDEMKNIHYALKAWEENGEVKKDFLL
jgi:hypothetical protein